MENFMITFLGVNPNNFPPPLPTGLHRRQNVWHLSKGVGASVIGSWLVDI